MRRNLIQMALVLALAAAPVSFAHDAPEGVAGTPDTTCETGSEWADHDYGPPALGLFIQGHQESNLEDCDGDFDPTDPFCYAEEVAREDLDGDTDVCEAFDDDGHNEYTRGGAWLLVNSGDGVTGGTVLCFGREGHHPNFGPVTVADLVFGVTVPFTVEADLVDITGLNDPCGDFQSDVSTSCVGTCTVTYTAGLDGSYQVYVGFGSAGTQGHVCTPGGDCDLGLGIDNPIGNPDHLPPGLFPAVVFVFDDNDAAPPQHFVLPGWTCTTPTFVASVAETYCQPDLATALFSANHAGKCKDPFAKAGGTFMTSGDASAYIECDGTGVGPNTASWTASQGSAEAVLSGEWDFPLKCRTSAKGTVITPGGKFYSVCGNGS